MTDPAEPVRMALHELGARLGIPTSAVRAAIGAGQLVVERTATNRFVASHDDLDRQKPVIDKWLGERRPGRPALDSAQVRGRLCGVRVTDPEGILLDEAAAAIGVDVSTFLRMSALREANRVIAEKKGGTR